MNTFKMSKPATIVYVVTGMTDAAIMGIMVLIIVDFGWSPLAAASALAFLASATVLMRAPFSKHNIDRGWVTALRAALILFLAFFGFEIAGALDGFYFEPIELGILASALVSMALLVLMPRMRRTRTA